MESEAPTLRELLDPELIPMMEDLERERDSWKWLYKDAQEQIKYYEKLVGATEELMTTMNEWLAAQERGYKQDINNSETAMAIKLESIKELVKSKKTSG
jgi:hypothetical protein